MICIYCSDLGRNRPTICRAHRLLSDVAQECAPRWRTPIPLEIYFRKLRARHVRVGIERVRALLDAMGMPYHVWHP